MTRNVTVTFDDGSTHVYQNVPDAATPDQVQARAAQEFGGLKVMALDGGKGSASAVAAPAPSHLDEFVQGLKQSPVTQAALGALRGAAGIGATLEAPIDWLNDKMSGRTDRGPSDLVTGSRPQSSSDARRASIDEGIQSLGGDSGNLAFKTGKLGTEVAGTAGAGGAVANVIGRAAPALAAASPNLLTAIRTAGMSAGNASGLANPLVRAAGGAINGGASAALVNPEEAGAGAAVGALIPGAAKIIGAGGNALGKLARGPEQAPELAAAIQKARDAGYVIPPSQANPTLANRVLEGTSGKLTTAQNSSAVNQAVTNAKAAAAIGLPTETTITPGVLDGVRAEAGKAYKAVSELGAFDATKAELPSSVKVTKTPANTLMGQPESASVDAGEVVRAWRQANADATAYFRAYGRDANPETLAKAKAAAGDAKQIDDFLVKQTEAAQQKQPSDLIADLAAGRIDQPTFLQKALTLGQQGDLAQNLKDARVLIAKTHSVEGAMNSATGTIDAKKLAQQLQKDKPLSGDLKDIAEFAGRFPKAAQTPEAMGSLPQTSPLDWHAAGAMGMALHNPLALAAVGIRPAARALTLSPMVQNRLIQQEAGQNALARLVPRGAGQIPYRAAPLLAVDR